MRTTPFRVDSPKNWQDFERLCHLLWMDLLNDKNIQLNGRTGQPQAGVDVYGTDASTGLVWAIQCKGKNSDYGGIVSEKELRKEVNNALKFSPKPPDVFILATTAPNDQKIQKIAREITKEHKGRNLFSVYVYGWDEICQRIPSSNKVLDEYYPQYSNKDQMLRYNIEAIKNSVEILSNEVKKENKIKSTFDSIENAKRCFANASHGLLAWPRTLHTGKIWITREEEETILTTFETAFYSTTIVLGGPGTGKSALLSNIANSLIGEENIVLAVKADQLPSSVIDFSSLGLALGLPGAADECIKAALEFGAMYLIIDQLDTISELIDIQTSRLHVLLNLIKQLSNVPGLHIIASSRPFEFKYDVRLSSINADKILLQAIEWKIVEDILKTNDIKAISLDEDFKNFLCRPSNLNFYLRYIKDNPQKAFTSHIELYENIWMSSLGKDQDRNRRREFLLKAATFMTNEAKQSVPVARFEEYQDDIHWLSHAGFLVLGTGNKSFSFAHQTLQAFVWTRAFIKENGSLIDFVLEHQHNLNIRPKLSTTLFYMREADPHEYNKQINLLLFENLSIVRKHVVYLVIDCLGAYQQPNDHEIRIFSHLVKFDSFRLRVCKAISGKEIWFDIWATSFIPKLMEGSRNDRFLATTLLADIYDKRENEVLSLIDRFWKNDEGLEFTFFVLTRTRLWTDKTLDLAINLIINDNAKSLAKKHLFHSIGTKSPTAAIRFAGAYFRHKLAELKLAPPPEIPQLADDASELDEMLHKQRYDIRQEYEKLLDFDTSWHNLPKFAQANPSLFISEFWSFFVEACECAKVSYVIDNNCFTDSGMWFHLSDEGRDSSRRYLCVALENSIQAFAKTNADSFIALYNAHKINPMLAVQRLLAKGLCAIADKHPAFVLSCIRDDRRRLKLGNYNKNKFTGSMELIAMLSPHLTGDDVNALQDIIKTFKSREHDDNRTVEGRQWDLKVNRKAVYFLLSAIPKELLNSNSIKLMREEERAFGKSLKEGIEFGRGGLFRQTSPMSEEQMQKASDNAILNCIRAFPDNREKDIPKNGVYVGALELGRTFGKFAEKYPNRAKHLITKLDVSNTYAATFGLIGLSNSAALLSELLDIIKHLNNKFSSAYFYEEAARAIRNKHSLEDPLPNEWCAVLESWLKVPVMETVNTTKANPEADQNKEESILWGYGKHLGMPGGNFEILETLTVAYLLRPEPMSENWIQFITRRLQCGENIEHWAAFSAIYFCRSLPVLKSDQAEGIIDALIEQYPEILGKAEIAYTIAWATHWASDDTYFRWISQIQKFGTALSSQIAGELLGVKLAIHPTNDRVHEIIVNAIDANNDEHILFGLGYTLKNIWRSRKAITTTYLVKLIGLNNSRLSSILMGLLKNEENMKPSDELNEIIDALISNRTLEAFTRENTHIAHCLVDLTAHEPQRVLDLCNQFITSNSDQLSDISTAVAAETEDLITISITLHNSGPTFQHAGLDMFERLLAVDAYQINEALEKIDQLPQIAVLT